MQNDQFQNFFSIFNNTQCTESRQSVLLSVIYHSLNPVPFTRTAKTWLIFLTYSTAILSGRYFYQKSGVCYNKWMLQWTVSINKIRVLHRTQWNITSRHSTHVHMNCQDYPLWLERQSSFLLSIVRFSYQFSSVICLFLQCIKVKLINFILFLPLNFLFCIIFFLFKWFRWMVTLL